MRSLKVLINCLIRFISVFLITLLPKKKSVWVFGAWFGKSYSDNPKYLYQYISRKHKKIIPIWITKDNSLVDSLRKDKINAYYYLSLKGLYFQSIASVALVGHSISSDLNPLFIGYNTLRVQLWHGMPLKKIEFDDDINKKKYLPFNLHKIVTNNYYDMIISTGSLSSEILSSAFRTPLNKIHMTGFPRNDVFNRDVSDESDIYKVIYMPTFRVNKESDFNFFECFGFDLHKVEQEFNLRNIELHIRTHPINEPPKEFLKEIEGSKVIKISTIHDIYEEINLFDCLVTDYSSVMFDFAISNKPILFAPFDLDSYIKNNRGLYHNYSSIVPNKLCNKDWPQLINSIIKAQENPDQYIKANAFVKSLHDPSVLNRGSFSEQVYIEIEKKINDK